MGDLLKYGAHYDKVKDRLRKDLKDQDFERPVKKLGKEPNTDDVTHMTTLELKVLYDDLLKFSNRLKGNIIVALSYKGTMEQRMKAVRAQAQAKSASDTSLKNADMRKAYVEKNEDVITVTTDHLYFKGKYDQYEEWSARVSKKLDRVYRELQWRHSELRWKSASSAPNMESGSTPWSPLHRNASTRNSSRNGDSSRPVEDTLRKRDVHKQSEEGQG